MTRNLYLGADVGGTNVKFAVVSASGEVILTGDIATELSDPRLSLDRMAAAAREGLSADAGEIKAAGLACAGIVSPATGILGRAPNLTRWEGADLVAAMAESVGLPAVVANDVNAALYGEWCLGAGRGFRDLVMIALGTGVGGAVMIDGRLVTGSRDGAGEIGHMILDPAGPLCSCGNRGCLESYAGARGLVQAAREQALCVNASEKLARRIEERGDLFSPSDLHDLALGGDPDSREVLDRAGRMLGIAVGNLVNVLDPQRVIIGGGVARAGDYLLEPCLGEAHRIVMSRRSREVDLKPAELGTHAASLGAAMMSRDLEQPR